MPLFVKVRSFIRNLFLSRRVEVDLDNEVRSHLELMTEEKVRAARMELGGVEQVKEQVRDERTGNWVQSVIADCRFGVRQLRKNSGFGVVAIVHWRWASAFPRLSSASSITACCIHSRIATRNA